MLILNLESARGAEYREYGIDNTDIAKNFTDYFPVVMIRSEITKCFWGPLWDSDEIWDHGWRIIC